MTVTRCVNSRSASGSTAVLFGCWMLGEWYSWGGGYAIHTGLVCIVYPPPLTPNTQIILPVSGSGCIWSVARLQGRSAKRPIFYIVSMSLHALHLITSNNFTSKCQYFIVK